MTKRKASRPSGSDQFIWLWNDGRKRANKGTKRLRGFARGRYFEDEDDDDYLGSGNASNSGRSKSSNQKNSVQLELFFKKAPEFNRYLRVPYEILIKIFQDLVALSDQPLKDLLSVSQVCEAWRNIILYNPRLWSRIDLSRIPMTNNNIDILNKILYPDSNKSNTADSSIKEFTMTGICVSSASAPAFQFLERVLASPKMESVIIRDIPVTKQPMKLSGAVIRGFKNCKNLRHLTISDAKLLFSQQKWISDFLAQGNGKNLHVLDLSLSMSIISPQLQRSICSDLCPNLRILDLTTCDCIVTNSFDIIQLASSAPNLEVFRAGNVSFKRISSPPVEYGFTKLRELSIPTATRDADRDDALYASLTYGSLKTRLLDIRGSTISAHAIIDTPARDVEELHMDDICPITRREYGRIVGKWSKSLKILSLVKINCSKTIKGCLDSLILPEDREHINHGVNSRARRQHHDTTRRCNIRELDLSSSDVEHGILRDFLRVAQDLESINLTSCRSLPRGCKGIYKKDPDDGQHQKLSCLIKRLTD